MWYEVHILDVGDADAIVIKYQADLNSRPASKSFRISCVFLDV